MQIFAPLNSEPHPDLQKIEVASSLQLPGLHIIGLPSPEVSEAKERVRAAIESCGFELPKRRVVLNLAPASIRKRGTGLDLAMAMAVLDLELPESSDSVAAWGEIGLDGSVKAAGQITRSVYAAWQGGIRKLFLAADDYRLALRARHWIHQAEFFSSPPPELVSVASVKDAWEKLLQPASLQSASAPSGLEVPEDKYSALIESSEPLLPLSPSVERSLCVSALGGHHILLLGPKGTGKSHAMEWLIALQPEMSPRMKVNHLLLLELSQHRKEEKISTPIRRISSNVRASALIGSFATGQLRPGEFSLAHGGVLIADEFPEWSRDSREALREPLERGRVTLTRAKNSVEFPARFSFAANGNLCPCGGWPAEFPIPMEAEQQNLKIPKCRCTHSQRTHYVSRLSGPILDRLDMVLLVGGSKPAFSTEKGAARLRCLQEKINSAREDSLSRWGGIPSMLASTEIEEMIRNFPQWEVVLEQLQLTSLRARHKTVRVALSLSAWDKTPEPQSAHFIEASCYRPERFGLCG